MSRLESFAFALLASALALSIGISGCGGSDICLGCDPDATPTPNPDNSVQVEGDLYAVIPDTLVEDMVVLVCTDRDESTPAVDCGGRSTRPDSIGDFSIEKVRPGALEVFFYPLGDASQLAQLDDPNDRLGDVRASESATIQSITVNLGTGIAEALNISVGPAPTPTPTPAP